MEGYKEELNDDSSQTNTRQPIFIGIGENDERNPRAKETVQIYKNWGADVTFEEWKGVAHSGPFPPEMFLTTKMLNWLLAAGPLKDVGFKLAEVRQAEKAGKLGKAFALYHQLSKVRFSAGGSSTVLAFQVTAETSRLV